MNKAFDLTKGPNMLPYITLKKIGEITDFSPEEEISSHYEFVNAGKNVMFLNGKTLLTINGTDIVDRLWLGDIVENAKDNDPEILDQLNSKIRGYLKSEKLWKESTEDDMKKVSQEINKIKKKNSRYADIAFTPEIKSFVSSHSRNEKDLEFINGWLNSIIDNAGSYDWLSKLSYDNGNIYVKRGQADIIKINELEVKHLNLEKISKSLDITAVGAADDILYTAYFSYILDEKPINCISWKDSSPVDMSGLFRDNKSPTRLDLVYDFFNANDALWANFSLGSLAKFKEGKLVETINARVNGKELNARFYMTKDHIYLVDNIVYMKKIEDIKTIDATLNFNNGDILRLNERPITTGRFWTSDNIALAETPTYDNKNVPLVCPIIDGTPGLTGYLKPDNSDEAYIMHLTNDFLYVEISENKNSKIEVYEIKHHK